MAINLQIVLELRFIEYRFEEAEQSAIQPLLLKNCNISMQAKAVP
jgi:hypothetical protein